MKTFLAMLFAGWLMFLTVNHVVAQDSGLPSAWDSESVDPLSGNVHLSIPLYSVRAGQDFGMSLALQYNSKIWDLSDLNFPNSPGNRNLLGKSVFGLGWNLHFGRLYSLSFDNGTNIETSWYFEGMDGATHRLYRKYNLTGGEYQAIPASRIAENRDGEPSPYRRIGTDGCIINPDLPRCGGGDPTCTADPYWYAYDGSGIRAQYVNNVTPNYWRVWTPDGTEYRLYNRIDNDLNTPEQTNFKGWYTTMVWSAARKANGSPMHSINIAYVNGAANPSRRYCPLSISDDLGRTVTFDCQASTAEGTVVDGGVVRSITVPAPHGQTLTYRLDHQVANLYDPIDFASTKNGILLLSGITALGVTPTHSFQFQHALSSGHLVGEVAQVTLPGGAIRSYGYNDYRVWLSDHPNIYDPTSTQFLYFPGRAVQWRQVEVNGTRSRWDYERFNHPDCPYDHTKCYNHPIEVRAKGPYDPSDPSISGSTTVYNYRATMESAGTPNPLDGTVSSVTVYAGPVNPSRQVRSTTFAFGFDPPSPGSCNSSDFLKGHYADNIRLEKITTSIDDDGKSPHDKRIVENIGWTMLTGNYGRFTETREFKADGVTLYRIQKTGLPALPLPSSQINAWVLNPIKWVRTIRGSDGAALEETDLSFDSFGRLETSRRLYAPGATAESISANDILSTFDYDDTVDGNLKQVDRQFPGQPAISESLVWQHGYLSTRHSIGIPWNSTDAQRDLNTGLPIEIRQPWQTGVRVTYDLLGRPTNVVALAGSTYPPISFTYLTNETSRIVGDPFSQSSIQTKVLHDGLGRSREARILKQDNLGTDQWVTRISSYDATGNVSSATEWAPVGTVSPPATRTERYGPYAGGIQAFDPLFRVRRVVGPDGSITVSDHAGLVSTTTVQGIQGGTISVPALISSTSKRQMDIFGRVERIVPCMVEPCAADQPLLTYKYEELDRLVETRTGSLQPRSKSFDPLGRLRLSEEPERGKVWFGSHTGDNVNPDGYDPNGRLIRYQDAAGYMSSPSYHYLLSYDAAGRLTKSERETEQAPQRITISSYSYDLADHGNGSYSHFGRLGKAIGYDEAGMVVSQNDYYYQDASGSLSHVKTAFDAWDGILGNIGQAGSGDTTFSTYYTYDSMGSIATITYPTTGAAGAGASSSWLSFSRARGLITSVNSNRGTQLVTSAVYNDALGLKEWNSPAGMKTQIIPEAGLPSRVREVKVTNSSGATQWTSGVYSYDGAGNAFTIGGDSFRYDSLGRLKEAQLQGIAAGTFYTQTFGYDAYSNIRTKTFAANFDPASTVTYNFNDTPAAPTTTNRINGLGTDTSWTYRADGALTQDDSFNYVYDNAGRLYQVKIKGTGTEVGRYLYDASGLRVLRRENHGKEVFSFRGIDGNVLSQFSRPTGSSLTPQWDRDFGYMANSRIVMIEKPLPSTVSWKFTESRNSGSASNQGIYLEWNAVPEAGIYGYRVYRKGPGEGVFSPIYPIATSAVTTDCTSSCTSYLNSGLTDGSRYIFRVAAVDTVGNEGASSPERIITFKDSSAPGAPTALTSTPGNGNVTLNWTAPSPLPEDFAGYYVYRKTGANYGSPLNAYPITDDYYYDVSVVNDTAYTYMIKAADTANLPSPSSNETVATPHAAGGGGGGEGGGGVSPRDQGCLDRIPFCDANEDGIPEGESDRLTCSPYQMIGQGMNVKMFFLHSDHLGSVRLVTNLVGGIESQHKYLPFGEEIQPSPSLNPFRFAGYERDPESANDYARARFYNSGRARWNSPDPLGAGFEYSHNNPIRFSDPSGLDPAGLTCTRICFDDGSCTPWSCEQDLGYSPPHPPGGPLTGPGAGTGPTTDPGDPGDDSDPVINPEPDKRPKCGYQDASISFGIPVGPWWGGIVVGSQKDDRTGKIFSYIGLTGGIDAGFNLVGVPNISWTQNYGDAPAGGVFVAGTGTYQGQSTQIGGFVHRWESAFGFSGWDLSDFTEQGPASSLGGVSAQAAVAFPLGLTGTAVDCQP